MSRIEEKDRRFRNLEIKVGAMAIVAIAGVILLVVLVGLQKDLFSAKYDLYFVSPGGSGLMEGMPVKLSGFKVGKVRSIELTEDARVKVTAEINRKYEKWIKTDSMASLSKEGFIGDPFIEISVGTSGANVLKDGEMVRFEKTGGIDELIEEAKPVLMEIKEIIHYANSPDGDIKVTLGNIRQVTTDLKETSADIKAAINEAHGIIKKLDSRSAPVIESAGRAMKNLEGITLRLDPVMTKIEKIAGDTEKVTARLPQTSEKLEKAIDNVKSLTDPLAGEGPRLRSIIRETQSTLKDTREVVKGVKESWPVRLMVPAPRSPELVPLEGTIFKRTVDEKYPQ